MLIPRKVKHRKQHHPRQRGIASGGTSVSFGDYGIQALEHAYITNRQIAPTRAPTSAPAIRRVTQILEADAGIFAIDDPAGRGIADKFTGIHQHF